MSLFRFANEVSGGNDDIGLPGHGNHHGENPRIESGTSHSNHRSSQHGSRGRGRGRTPFRHNLGYNARGRTNRGSSLPNFRGLGSSNLRGQSGRRGMPFLSNPPKTTLNLMTAIQSRRSEVGTNGSMASTVGGNLGGNLGGNVIGNVVGVSSGNLGVPDVEQMRQEIKELRQKLNDKVSSPQSGGSDPGPSGHANPNATVGLDPEASQQLEDINEFLAETEDSLVGPKVEEMDTMDASSNDN